MGAALQGGFRIFGGAMAKVFQLYVDVHFWHDGDTFYGILDQGFGQYKGKHDKLISCRCAFINTPELKDHPAGIDAAKFANRIAPPDTYECYTYKLDNFGRPLVDLILTNTASRFLFSEVMIENGHAVRYKK
jgi:endonuclease YncB( thermonuclease family)